MKNIIYKITLLTLICILGCETNQNNKDNPSANEPGIIELNSKAAEVISSTNQFGIDIFKAVLDESETNENVFISPVSIAIALTMTYNGANSSTKDSMAFALRFPLLTDDEINLTYKELIAGLTTVDEQVLLSIANSIWYRQDFNVLDDFININESNFDAKIEALDFSDPASVDIINNWVEEKTNYKIQDLITQISPAHVMFLINAIYFKGIWQKQFDPDNTYEGPFYNETGSTHTTEFMSLKDSSLNYWRDNNVQILELDYGRGNYSMVILLPSETYSVEELADELTPETWNNWMGSLQKQEVEVALPKFKFEYEKKLNDVLANMGMGIAFTDMADFSGINGTGGLMIDYVKHKSFIEVNEEGTEAAAATVVAIIETSAGPDSNYFIANRPFLFVIREKSTNSVVFIGKFTQPEN